MLQLHQGNRNCTYQKLKTFQNCCYTIVSNQIVWCMITKFLSQIVKYQPSKLILYVLLLILEENFVDNLIISIIQLWFCPILMFLLIPVTLKRLGLLPNERGWGGGEFISACSEVRRLIFSGNEYFVIR